MALVEAVPLPGVLLDAAGVVVAANAGAKRLLGTEIAGRGFRARLAELEGGATEPGTDSFAWGSGRVEIRDWKGSGGSALALILEHSQVPDASLAHARRVASSVKHEINNLLMGLLGLATLLRGRPELNDGSRAKAQQIEEQARKIRDVAARLDEIKSSER